MEQHNPAATSTSVIVGSYLYEIGGDDGAPVPSGGPYLSNKIRFLNLENPGEGWKEDTLPFYFRKPNLVVYDHLIYFFPADYYFTTNLMGDDLRVPCSKWPWAYIYDTHTRTSSELKLPEEGELTTVPLALSLEQDYGGVIVPVIHKSSWNPEIFLHDPIENSWVHLGAPGGAHDAFRDICRGCPLATANGIMYAYSRISGGLNMYEIGNNEWTYLGTLPLQQIIGGGFDSSYDTDVFIHPESARELSIVWHNPPEISSATISFCLEHPDANRLLRLDTAVHLADIQFITYLPLSLLPKHQKIMECLQTGFLFLLEQGEVVPDACRSERKENLLEDAKESALLEDAKKATKKALLEKLKTFQTPFSNLKTFRTPFPMKAQM